MNPILHYEFGKRRKAFVSTWKTDNTSVGSSTSTQVKLPLNSSGTYAFRVEWGDGTSDNITVWNAAATMHTYASAGTYTIRITGICTGWFFNNTGDRLKILSVSSWGNLRFFLNQSSQFYGCANLSLSSVNDVLNLTGNTNISDMFRGCTTITTINRINEWNTSGITLMVRSFEDATNFNSNIGNWTTSSVTQMNSMFRNASSFNNGESPTINNWVTTSVTTMNAMFDGASVFNQPIGNWTTSSVIDMNVMFRNASNFNQPLSWNVIAVTTMAATFQNATNFNQNIGAWDVRNVTVFTNFMAGKTAGTFSTANLNAIYNGWSSRPVQQNLTITFGTAKYTAGASAGRAILTGAPNNWAITDGGI